jgi:hypothetical protein
MESGGVPAMNIKVLVAFDVDHEEFTARLEEFLLAEQAKKAVTAFSWTGTKAPEDLKALNHMREQPSMQFITCEHAADYVTAEQHALDNPGHTVAVTSDSDGLFMVCTEPQCGWHDTQ